jgi:hypothetical protein
MSLDWDTLSRLFAWKTEQMKHPRRKHRTVAFDFDGDPIREKPKPWGLDCNGEKHSCNGCSHFKNEACEETEKAKQ